MATTLDAPKLKTAAPSLSFPLHSNWLRTLQNALIVTRREVRDSFRDWRIMVPIFLLTLCFPLLAQGMTELFANFFIANGAEPMIDVFLPLLPMIVGFFPISISLVIALETFVGEKERRSLEPLLSTPLTNLELYIGKTLAAVIPPLLAAYVGIGIYLGALIFGAQQWRPQAELVIQIVLLTTAQALVMVTGSVVVSSQTTSTRASNLLASFIIIPMSLLVIVEGLIMVNDMRHLLWWILVALIIADVLLFRMGARLFNREELLGRTIDSINLKWAWQILLSQLRGDKRAKGVLSWYRYSVLKALRDSRDGMLVVSFSIVAMLVAGMIATHFAPDWRLTPEMMTQQPDVMQNFTQFAALSEMGFGVRYIFGQNLRVLIGAAMLAIFTFGVMSIFLASFTFGVLGFLLAQPIMSAIGYDTVLAALLPHAIFEVPALIIGAGVATRLGALVTSPPKDMGVWEAWLRAFADMLKLLVAVAVPLLAIGAVVEVYVTPRIVLMTIGS
ncbi:MAG: stage II sporulation protein M [Anaerolineae bacterium]|nr:stage II sporulation protein M [Anaerolineae bacterium]MDW8300132.1 stage II sporulation protein M [Anaerolineae bacterium]